MTGARAMAVAGLWVWVVFGVQAQGMDRVRLDGLGGWSIDRTEVTIAQFRRFVQETGTITRAEREGGGFEYSTLR